MLFGTPGGDRMSDENNEISKLIDIDSRVSIAQRQTLVRYAA